MSFPKPLAVPVLLILLGRYAHSSPIPINNAGFEEFALTDNQFTVSPGLVPSLPSFAVVSSDPIPGWTITGQQAGSGFGFASFASSWNPYAASFPGGAPEGQNAALAERLSAGDMLISQTLTSALAATTYILRAQVGDRLETNFDSYRLQLLAGGVLLAEDNNSVHPPDGTWVETTPVVFTALPDNPHLGAPLEIRIVVNGRVAIDDIRLEEVPEPTSYALGALALVGLFALRRRLASHE